MDFTENIFRDFEKKFTDTIPGETPVYVDSKDNTFILEDNVKELIEKSLKDNKNYLLNYKRIIFDPNVFY